MADVTSLSLATSLAVIEERLDEPEPMCVVAVGVGPASDPSVDTWTQEEVVAEVGRRLRSTLRSYDEIHELPGGWFAVLLPTLAEADGLETRIGRLFELVAGRYPVAGVERPARVLLGASVRHPADTAASFLARVGAAIGQARANGGAVPVLR